MGYYKIINGIRWYYRLKPQDGDPNKKGLFSDTPRSSLSKSLIVSLSHKDHDHNNTYLLFTHFKSYLEYGIYMMKLPRHERCFYEIILGESAQKPHFDLDIPVPRGGNVNGDEVVNNLVDGIIKVLGDRGIKIIPQKDVLIFTSHGETKQSYHVVINNYCHTNNIEARAFHDMVIDHIKPENKQWVDSAVYSPTQQFRIVGSQKIGTTRVKVLSKVWLYNNTTINFEYPEPPDSPEHELVMQLESSIIGFTGNCRFLPPFEPRADMIKNYMDIDDVDVNDAHNAINLIAVAGKITVDDSRFPYKFLGINGPIVMLKRTKPSNCRICNRVHEHENPYLIVIGDEKNVYFHCRRAPENKKLFLGKLKPSNNTGIEAVPAEMPEEDQRINDLQIKWTKNVVDRLQNIANKGTGNEKRIIITGETEIDPAHKKQFIDMYVNSEI